MEVKLNGACKINQAGNQNDYVMNYGQICAPELGRGFFETTVVSMLSTLLWRCFDRRTEMPRAWHQDITGAL